MNTDELISRVYLSFSGYGHYKVRIIYRGKDYTCTTTNMSAVDKVGEDERTPNGIYVTEKQALLALYNECKRKNNLN